MNFDGVEIKADLKIVAPSVGNMPATIDEEAMRLCECVGETGSLNKAAKKMGMSYSRAWRILNRIENAFGIRILDTDGARGSVPTDEAEKLIGAFYSAQEAAEKVARETICSAHAQR